MENSTLKIFILSNSEFDANNKKQFLNDLGYTNASTFSISKDLINSLIQKPHVIILNHSAQADTDSLISKINNISPNTYIILLSDINENDIMRDYLFNGVFDFMIKNENVKNQLNTVLGRVKSNMSLAVVKPKKVNFLQKVSSFFW